MMLLDTVGRHQPSLKNFHKLMFWCSIETLSVKRTVFEIFDFKNAMTLSTRLGVRQGHWKYHHSIERIRLPIDVL